MILTREKVDSTIHFLPEKKIAYLNNAKAACSTIKKSLWLSSNSNGFREDRGPHDRKNSPFLSKISSIYNEIDAINDTKFFTVVRNPYSRILSSYLDKISVEVRGQEKERDIGVWLPFSRRYRLDYESNLKFKDFLKIISQEDPSLLDQHFAPQCNNTLQYFTSCDFIGHMEKMDDVWTFLSSFGVVEHNHRTHNTKAENLIKEFYGPEEIDIVDSIYHRDFEVYNYYKNPYFIMPKEKIIKKESNNELLKNLILSYAAPTPAARQAYLDQVADCVPEMIKEFNELENNSIPIQRLRKLAREVVHGHIKNWKFIALIAQRLLEHDLIHDAARVIYHAKLVMYEY